MSVPHVGPRAAGDGPARTRAPAVPAPDPTDAPQPHPDLETYPGPYPPKYPGAAGLRRLLTATIALTATAAIVFSFRNIWPLAAAAGINPLIAPLIAPTVDASVLGLLTMIRAGVLRGIPRRALRPATRLLHACGTLSLVLNIAPAAGAHAFTRAGLDAIAPSLLIAWAAVASGLYDALADPGTPPTGTAPGTAASAYPPGAGPVDTPAVPATAPGTGMTRAPGVRRPPATPPPSRSPAPGRRRGGPSPALLARAATLDADVRAATGHPASIRQLRTLGIGQHRAQQLQNHLAHTDTHTDTRTSAHADPHRAGPAGPPPT